MKIIVLDGYTENPGDLSWDELAGLGQLTVYDRTESDKIIERISDAEIILTNKTPINAEVFERCPSIRYIGVLATGYNIVDVNEARKRNVIVANVPSYGTQAVAQYVFALLLELCHHVGHHNQQVQKGRWSSSEDFCFWDYPLVELAGKTLGIIGYGRIGRATAAIARAFGMNVLAYSPRHTETGYVPLDTVFHESDIISLHCPLTADNHMMINRNTIAQMKNGVMIINTARGALVDEQALREALIAGKVSGAAVDVVSQEPIRNDNPLLGLNNCLITPHIAWASYESRVRLMDVAVKNVQAFIEGHPMNAVT